MSFLARTVTPANGSDTLFPVSFPLAPIQGRDGVGVYVHTPGSVDPGPKKVEAVDYSWVSDGQISFLPGHVPAGGVVDVRRETNLNAVDNLIQSGGSLRSSELAENDQQLLYLVQERVDEVTDLKAQLAQAVLMASQDNNSSMVNVKAFGALGDGVTRDVDGPAFVNALAFLKSIAQNGGVTGVYKGSPKLLIPMGHYLMGTTTIDLTHTIIIEGESGGRAPHPAYGSTHLEWDLGCSGIRVQFDTTFGDAGVDLVNIHQASGGAYLRDFSMSGSYLGGANDNHAAIVARSLTYLDNILIRNWAGTGVQSWTGNTLISGEPLHSGNTSVSFYSGVKVEGTNIGFDTRGTDSNVITFLNCEGYQCRTAGFIDNNGAGSNTYIGCLATFNGLASFSQFTQVSYSGKFYALQFGQEAWGLVNAPTGAANDNQGWAYVGPGLPDAIRPAWVNGMAGLVSGGDYVMLSNFPTILLNCYSEGGGFSQLGVGTLVIGGTNIGLASIGGSCWVPEYDGVALKRLHAAAVIHLDGADNAANGITSRDSAGQVGSLLFNNQAAFLKGAAPNGVMVFTLSGGVATYVGQWLGSGINLPTGVPFSVNGLKVVGDRGAAVADAVHSAAAPTQAEFNAFVDQFNLMAARLRASTGHGLITG